MDAQDFGSCVPYPSSQYSMSGLLRLVSRAFMNFPDLFLILTLQCSHRFPGFRSQFSPVLTVYAHALGELLNLSVPRFLPLEVRVVTVPAHWAALRIGYVQTCEVWAGIWYLVHTLRAGCHVHCAQ